MKRVTIMAHVAPDICRGCRVCEKSVPSMPFMSPIGRRRWRNPTAGGVPTVRTDAHSMRLPWSSGKSLSRLVWM